MVTMIALVSVQAKPDIETDKILNNSKKILITLDYDESGGKSSWQWWL